MEKFQDLVGLMPWNSIFVLVNLLILTWGLKKFLFKPVKAVFEARKAEIDNTYQEAETAKTTAEEMRSEYEERLANAKVEAAGIVKDATHNAAVRADEIVGEAKADAAAVRAKAEADIMRERKKAESELKNDISSIALSIAGKVVEKEIDADKHKDLIDEFINNVGDAG